MTVNHGDLAALPRDESLDLLRSVPVGRIVFTERAMPAIRPVNFAVMSDGDVVIRTAAGSALAAATKNSVVAFEADHIDGARHQAWSVVVTGRARHVTDVEEIAEIDGAMPRPWALGERHDVIRISADIVDGRRLTGDGDGTSEPTGQDLRP